MTDVRINGVSYKPVQGSSLDGFNPGRLRTIVQDSHLNFLIGAGTPSAFFGLLGNVEDALMEVAESAASEDVRDIVRASIHAHFSTPSSRPTSR